MPTLVDRPRLIVLSVWWRSHQDGVECRVTAEGGTAGPVDQPLDIVILDTDGAWEIDLRP